MLEWRLVKNIAYTIMEDFYWIKHSASAQLLQNRVVLFSLLDAIAFPSSKLNAVNLPPDSLWMSDNLSCLPAKSWTAFVTTSVNANSICFFHVGTDRPFGNFYRVFGVLDSSICKDTFFLSSALSDSGNTPFQISPTSLGTVQPHAIRWDRIRKIACLSWLWPISCSFSFLPPLPKQPGGNLGQAVGGGANRAPRTTGHRWLGLEGSQLSCNLPASLVWCFSRWPWYVFFDAGKSCLQSSISCLKARFHKEGNHTKTCSGVADIHSDKITDPACRGGHHARDDARELRGNFGSKNIQVDWSLKVFVSFVFGCVVAGEVTSSALESHRKACFLQSYMQHGCAD